MFSQEEAGGGILAGTRTTPASSAKVAGTTRPDPPVERSLDGREDPPIPKAAAAREKPKGQRRASR